MQSFASYITGYVQIHEKQTKSVHVQRLTASMTVVLQASDNMRPLQTKSGEPWLLPAHETRRVILCSGQIYYTLARARRSRQIRDVILVRLEQIAPFPHDLVTQVCCQITTLCSTP